MLHVMCSWFDVTYPSHDTSLRARLYETGVVRASYSSM